MLANGVSGDGRSVDRLADPSGPPRILYHSRASGSVEAAPNTNGGPSDSAVRTVQCLAIAGVGASLTAAQ